MSTIFRAAPRAKLTGSILAILLAIIAISCAVVFTSCNISDDEQAAENGANLPKVTDPELDKARALWQSKNVLNYDMLVYGDIPGDAISVKNVKIRIREGREPLVLSAGERETGTLVAWEGLETIENFFDAIQGARNMGKSGNDVPIVYDKEFGYPKKIFMKEGGVVEIKSFRVAKKDEEWRQ